MSVSSLIYPGAQDCRSEIRRLHFAALDFCALLALLAACNFVVSPRDFGWFAVNPAPYLFIPILLGLHHGLRMGASGGLLTVLVLLLGRWAGGQPLEPLAHGVTMLSYPLVGALAGRFLSRREGRGGAAKDESRALEEENAWLRAERELMLLSRQDRQQRQGPFAVESPFEQELAGLSETPTEGAPAQLLSTLARLTKVRSAALYVVPEGCAAAPVARTALLGNPRWLPEHLYRQDHPIVREALASSSFLVQKTLLEPVPSRGVGFLGAYPIPAGRNDVSYLLVVQDMPIGEARSDTFESMKSICDWMKFALAGPARRPLRARTVKQCEFYAAMEEAVTGHRQDAVASTLIRLPFELPEGVDAAAVFPALLKALPPETVLTNSNELGERSLLFLMPGLSGAAERERLRAAILSFGEQVELGEGAAPRFFTTNPGETPQQLWGRLVAVNQDFASQ